MCGVKAVKFRDVRSTAAFCVYGKSSYIRKLIIFIILKSITLILGITIKLDSIKVPIVEKQSYFYHLIRACI